MPDKTSLAEQQLVEGHLRELSSLDRLRRLFADLNYQVSDEPVSIADWKPELAKTAKDGSLRVVARHQDFVVTHCRLQELRVSSEREVVTRLVRQYDRGLFAFSDLGESRWHLVNVKRDSRRHNRLVLRRIVIGSEEQLRTAIERISLLKVRDASWAGLQVELEHEDAFDVEKVTDQFYWDYRGIFDHIVDRLQHQVNLRTARAFAQQFMNRMMFLYFLQKKGWLDGRRDFVPWLWQKYKEDPAAQGNFYTRYLDPLFFLGLTSPSDDLTPSVTRQQLYARRDIPDEIKQAFLRLPFLNGGLFRKIDGVDDQSLEILDSEFENLFESLLEHYNFTVSEDTPLDVEVAVNPEMLGKVYENLVLEEERGRAGIFYTPRVELDFMCRRALIEYLDEEPIVDRPDLIRLVMNADTPEFVPDFPPERLREIHRKLEEVTVVDPACGSGAFLVGMMQVLSGLYRLICERLEEPYHDFAIKKRIVGENLFGVDIKDWAVRVAELRLWLSLIINAELQEAQECPGKAILPNLTFRIQAGDSLVEEIAGRSLSLRGRYNQMSTGIRRQISHLVDRKMDYYYNRGEVMPPQEIRRLETDAFQAILDDEVSQIDRELRRLRAQEQEGFQQELDIARAGGPVRAGAAEVSPEKARLRRDIERLEQERAQIIAVRNSEDIERGKGPFLWDIEFAEVFHHKGGFDIVIGNPPYVRDEDIAPANLMPDEVTPSIKEAYKEQLQRSIAVHWGSETKIQRQADLYIYFYFHGLALLRIGGTFCFITSNSWLDVSYGDQLQESLLRRCQIVDIYDNRRKRTFSRSQVNTVIVLFRRPSHGTDVSDHVARFVAFKKPFEEVLTADILVLLEWADTMQSTDDLRVYPVSQAELWQTGLDSADDSRQKMSLGFGLGQYRGGKWGGKYLRAPDVYIELASKAGDRLVRLDDQCFVWLGVMTGQNKFFFVELIEGPISSGLPSVVRCRNGFGYEFMIESRFLRPVTKKTSLCDSLKGCPDENLFTLVAGRHDDIKGTHFEEYIRWGEKLPITIKQGSFKGTVVHGIHRLKFFEGRVPWWVISDPKVTSFACVKLIGETHKHTWLQEPTVVDQSFYGLEPLAHVSDVAFAAALTSTLWIVSREIAGRRGMGGGALQLGTWDIRGSLIPAPSLLEPYETDIQPLLNRIASRQWLPVEEEVQQADRQALDALVGEALGISQQDQDNIREAAATMVEDRLYKAGSI